MKNHRRSLANRLILFICILFSICSTCAYAEICRTPPFHYPRLYAGLSIGYGQTTWPELVTKDKLVYVSAPVEAHDFGTIWGVFLGYQFGRSFALEANYTRYPNTRLFFDEYTFYYPVREFTTHTQVFSTLAKFIIPIANSRINAFLDAGVGFTHRNDILAKVTRVGPTFGLGFMSNASRRILVELGFEYYAGYARSNHLPVKDFIPFVYGVYFKLGVRII